MNNLYVLFILNNMIEKVIDTELDVVYKSCKLK